MYGNETFLGVQSQRIKIENKNIADNKNEIVSDRSTKYFIHINYV